MVPVRNGYKDVVQAMKKKKRPITRQKERKTGKKVSHRRFSKRRMVHS